MRAKRVRKDRKETAKKSLTQQKRKIQKSGERRSDCLDSNGVGKGEKRTTRAKKIQEVFAPALSQQRDVPKLQKPILRRQASKKGPRGSPRKGGANGGRETYCLEHEEKEFLVRRKRRAQSVGVLQIGNPVANSVRISTSKSPTRREGEKEEVNSQGSNRQGQYLW